MFGAANLTNCTLTADTARGGNANFDTGTPAESGNSGSGYGGAIFNLDGQVSLTFCTLANNTVSAGTSGLGPGGRGVADGGALYNLGFGSTLDGLRPQTATATITNSILANSTGGPDLVNNVNANANRATVTLSGPNLVMTQSGQDINGTPLTGNPALGPLQNNGGPGMQTMAISSSSPAFQVGTRVANVTNDQRGLPRPATPSLGAFEPQPAPPAPPAVAASIQFTTISVTPNPFALSATETITVKVSQSGGSVTFAVGGQNVQVVVDANGNATVTLTVPLLSVLSPQSITAAYNGVSASANAATTASWFALIDSTKNMVWNLFLTAIDKISADGTQIVTYYFNGSPLLFIAWSPSGQLRGFGLGAG
jgi:hypothetical protein